MRKSLLYGFFLCICFQMFQSQRFPWYQAEDCCSHQRLFWTDTRVGEDVIICGWSLDISDNNTVSNMGDNTTHTDKEIEVINSQLHPVQHCFNFSGLIQIFFHSLPRKLYISTWYHEILHCNIKCSCWMYLTIIIHISFIFIQTRNSGVMVLNESISVSINGDTIPCDQ